MSFDCRLPHRLVEVERSKTATKRKQKLPREKKDEKKSDNEEKTVNQAGSGERSEPDRDERRDRARDGLRNPIEVFVSCGEDFLKPGSEPPTPVSL